MWSGHRGGECGSNWGPGVRGLGLIEGFLSPLQVFASVITCDGGQDGRVIVFVMKLVDSGHAQRLSVIPTTTPCPP
jgi:hypothetical protein